MSMDSIDNSGVVRFVHSKVTTNSFQLTSLAYPRAPELSVHEMFPLSSVVIPLPPSDIVYLVERSSASVAVLTSHSTLGFDVGDPVVFIHGRNIWRF